MYFAEYFSSDVPENPYVEDPKDVRCLSVSADGKVLCGNVYENDISDILRGYNPT